jgi:formylglycine-generating enzyme required for sulfatase activity
MEQGLRAGGFLIVALVMLAGCKPQPAAPALERVPVPKQEPLPAQEGRVSISGDDALAGVLSWTLPEVHIDSPTKARAAARRALAKGDLFETAESAIPLLLALQKAQPGNEQDARLLEKAQAALLSQAWTALAENEDLASLRYAQRHGTVLRTLWPEQPEVREYLDAVDRVGQAFELGMAGERAMRAGNLDAPGGALELFRKAQALWPAQGRAPRGIAAVESALIVGAQAKAAGGDFNGAYLELARAERVRHDPQTIPEARERIEVLRADRIRRLGDEGLMALGDPGGLQVARERLAEMLGIALPGDAASVALRQRIDLVGHYGLFRPGQVFTDEMPDAGRGPELSVLPRGGFLMGAAEDEPDASADEQPRHRVDFERGFAMTRREITIGQFRRFVEATGYVPRATQRGHSMAYDARSGNFLRGSGIDWRAGYDGRPAADGMPVIHVTARDAEAYAAWLSEQTGAHYRLPSEAEFEYALRAGGQGRYPWGNGAPPAESENLAGGRDVSPQGRRWSNAFPGYGDGRWGPAPAGSFAPNVFGLYDMAGNVSEWVADCWHKGYRRAPANGAAWVNPGCRTRMYRGGSWASAPAQARSAWRMSGGVDVTNARVGFRLVRQL